MSKNKIVILVLLLALVVVGILTRVVFSRIHYQNTHVFVGEDAYPKDAAYLDLRGEKIALSDYLQLRQALPDCRIDWDVPFQGRFLSQDTEVLTVTSLSYADQGMLVYFPKLTTLDMTGADAQTAFAVAQALPQYTVIYNVILCGERYPWDTREITLVGASDADIAALKLLPQLEKVRLEHPDADPESVLALEEQVELSCLVEVHGITVETGDTQVDFSNIALSGTEDIAKALSYISTLETVEMHNCGIDNETMAAFREEHRAQYKVVWTVQCGGITIRTDAVDFMPYREGEAYFNDEDAYNLRYLEDMICMDLGHMPVKNIEFVKYMPHLKYLILAHTTVLDISPISSCKELIFLELDWTGIKDYTPLLGCTALEDLNLGKTYGDPEPILQMTWLKHLWWVGRGYKVRVQVEEALVNTVTNFTASYTAGGGWRELPNYYAMRDLLGMEYMK